MAVDKMINETQGNDIIDKLSDIADNLDNVSVITPAKFGMGLATCNTAADVAAKTCNLANYVLTDGAPVSVKFTYANTASNPTLNINGTGAKPMYYKGTAMGTNVLTAGDIATFIYDVNGIYHIINIDTLAGPGAGTVTSVGATDGITTDQTSGTAIQGQGSVKLNLKSNSTYTGTVANPSTDASIANGNVYPVALDGDGHPVVGVPWTDEGVKQTEVNTDASYELLFAKSTGTGEKTEGVSKSAKATMNPSTGAFTVNGEISGTGFTGDGVKTSFASQTSDLSDKKVPSEKLVKTSLDEKVAGPSSVTGDTIVLFDSTTGKLVKSSSKTFESSYAISDDDNKIPTSKGIRENAATYGKLGTYSADTSRTNITDNTTIKGAVKQLEYREELNKSNILYVSEHNANRNLLLNTASTTTIDGVTFTVNADKSVTITGSQNNPNQHTKFVLGKFTANRSDLVLDSGIAASASANIFINTQDGVTTTRNLGHATITGTDLNTERDYQILVIAGTSNINTTIKPMICTQADWNATQEYEASGGLPNYDLTLGLAELNAHPFLTVPINHNMVYRGQNLGATLTDAQHTALSSGNFTDLYLGDYWTKTVTIPAGTYTGGDGEEVTVPAQTNITLKAVIADFDTFYAGYASNYAGINTHHAAVIVTGFGNVVWNKTNSTAGGYVASLIHKWLVGSVLPQMETWFGSAKVLSHQKLLTNAITGDAASGWAWSAQKIALLSENQMYGSKVWGGSKATNGAYEPGEAFKHLSVFNHIDANLLFGNNNIWLRDIASAEWAASLLSSGYASYYDASNAWFAPAALILLS